MAGTAGGGAAGRGVGPAARARAPVPQPRCRGRRLPRPPRRALGPTALATDAPRRRSHGVARGHGDRPPARPVIAHHPPAGPGRPCGDPAGRHGGRRHRPTAGPTPPRPSGQGRGRAGGCPAGVVRRRPAAARSAAPAVGRLLRCLHASAGHDRHRGGHRQARGPADLVDHDRHRPGPRPLRGRHRRRAGALDRLGRRGRVAVPGGVTRRVPRHLRHRPQGPPSRSQQGLPRCRRRVRDRHLRHTRPARGARRGRHLRPTRRRRRPERGHHEPEQEPVRRRHRPRPRPGALPRPGSRRPRSSRA